MLFGTKTSFLMQHYTLRKELHRHFSGSKPKPSLLKIVIPRLPFYNTTTHKEKKTYLTRPNNVVSNRAEPCEKRIFSPD
ncbi:MAG TPA: hypothetical protein DCG57_12265 [Candidatus Riflebacteria bacterium]|jgi:hypothetical protein|nr:hypothetical protein [Candidatus Riflebacteria bacterium]